MVQAFVYFEEFIYTMGAGMASQNGFASVPRKFRAQAAIGEQLAQAARYFRGVARHQKIPPGNKQSARIAPPRRNQRNPARERFEHANGGDARKRFQVGAAGDMQGNAGARESGRRLVVGNPSAAEDPGTSQRFLRRRRVADSVDFGREPQRTNRIDQEALEFARALFVAPVADPDQVARLTGRKRLAHWVEHAHVGGFVPGPGAARPPLALIEIANDIAEGEHAIVAGKVVLAHAGAIRYGAVMRIVEQQVVTAAAPPVGADAGYQFGRVPFMHQD